MTKEKQTRSSDGNTSIKTLLHWLLILIGSLLLFTGLSTALLLIMPKILLALPYEDKARVLQGASSVGDALNVLNGLFATLAFICSVIAIQRQIADSHETKQAVVDQQRAIKDQCDAILAQNHLLKIQTDTINQQLATTLARTRFEVRPTFKGAAVAKPTKLYLKLEQVGIYPVLNPRITFRYCSLGTYETGNPPIHEDATTAITGPSTFAEFDLDYPSHYATGQSAELRLMIYIEYVNLLQERCQDIYLLENDEMTTNEKGKRSFRLVCVFASNFLESIPGVARNATTESSDR